MRIACCLPATVLLTLCVGLTSCATFCDYDEPDPLDPGGHSTALVEGREIYGPWHDRCVTATVFDVIGAIQDADRAP